MLKLKTNPLVNLAAVALLAVSGLVVGCGGGKSGSPAVSSRSGSGLVKMDISFAGTAGHERYLSSRQGSQDSSITVNVQITGVYSADGSEFAPVSATVTIDPVTGIGRATLPEVPIGRNHLLTATANFSTGPASVLGLIEEVVEKETSQGQANQYTTPAVLAMQSSAASSGKKLNELSYSQYQTYVGYVQALEQGGFDLGNITPDQLLAYKSVSGVPAVVTATPSTISMAVGDTESFSAVVKDANGQIANAALLWETAGGIGAIDANGLFHATAPGEGTVTVTVGQGNSAVTDTASVTVLAACAVDSDCDDGDETTYDACKNAGTATAACTNTAIACFADADCDDADALTIDACVDAGAVASACEHTPCNVACADSLGCNDENILTIDSCANAGTCDAACFNESCAIDCTTDAGCDDTDPLTADSCSAPGTCDAICVNTPCEPACVADADCDDQDANGPTSDVCESPGTCAATCVNTACSPACVSNTDCNDFDANGPTADACFYVTSVCDSYCTYTPCTPACTADADCDDSNGQTMNLCVDPNTCAAACDFSIAIACEVDADCDDLDPGTADTCLDGGKLTAVCDNVSLGDCSTDAECDDADAWTLDVCENAGTAQAVCAHKFPSVEGTYQNPVCCSYYSKIALNGDGSRLYMLDGEYGELTWFDTQLKTFSADPGSGISISGQGIFPDYMVSDPSQNALYIAGNFSMAAKLMKFDMSTDSIVQTINLSGGYYLKGRPAISQANGKLYYVAGDCYYSCHSTVGGVDLTSFSVVQTVNLSNTVYPLALAVDEVNNRLFVPEQRDYYYGIYVVDLSSFSQAQIISNIAGGGYGYRPVVDSTRNKLFTSTDQYGYEISVIDLSSLSEVSAISLYESIYSNQYTFSLFESTGHLFVPTSGALKVIDADTESVLGEVTIPSGYVNDMVVDEVNGKVYIASSSSISVISYDVAAVKLAGYSGGPMSYWYNGLDMYIEVADPAANADNMLAEEVQVDVVNTATGELETVTLIETGVDTGVFSALLATQYGTVAGTDNDQVLDASYGQVIEATYTGSAGTKTTSIKETGA